MDYMKGRILTLTLGCLTLAGIAQTTLTLEDIWRKGTFRQKSVYGLRSMKDGLHYTVLEEDSNGMAVKQYSYKTGQPVKTLLTEATLRTLTGTDDAAIEEYQFSADERQVLITSGQEHIYRHSTREHYYVVNLGKNTAVRLGDGAKQRLADFSPDGTKIAYVQGNDLFVYDLATGSARAITTDGEENKIINGFPDWVYEEEFSFDKAFSWSPDGSRIAYYKFDESGVKEFNMQQFTGLYPADYRYKYPKAGEDNSRVTIHVYDLSSEKTHDLDLGDYEYIPRIKWTQNSDFLAVIKMPRLQNELEILLVNTGDYTAKTVYKESSATYLEIGNDLTFYGDNAGFIWKSEKDGFFHFYSYDMDGKNERRITSGEWDVKEFLGYDESAKKLFFTASKTAPENQEVYSVSLKGGKMQLLSPDSGHSEALFSEGFKYYIRYHSTANSPLVVTLHSGDGKLIRTLEDNAGLKEKMNALNLPRVEFFNFATTEGIGLNGWMIKPRDFDPGKKYPVLMHVYGGPGSNMVSNAMGGNYWWHQLMAERGYIIACVDNRGTGSRGRDFRTITYGQLGKYETADQIEAARWLGSQPYVDQTRIGIWGWSYGGYMSSLCLFKGAEYFKAAVAVAPVTNWRFYDSIYTERYMGLPKDNASGYDDNSPINHVDKLQGRYLLVHGTGDDNVHYQNTVEMVDALIAADKQFDLAIYPERNHGIYGGNTRYHLFTRITDFITENL